jgi:hypothetical protein
MRTAKDGALALRAALREGGGTISELIDGDSLRDHELAAPGPPQRAAQGPRAAGNETEYELLLEMILEGSLLHYGGARVVITDDPDLSLLLGDQLYALGLCRLAELGDLTAVAELADLISLLAQAQTAADAELAEAVWEASAAAVGWGPSERHERAKALARAGDAGAAAALLEVAGEPGLPPRGS